ncbi:MAG: ATP-binding protein [Phycisphaerae bacterium]
MSQSKKFTIRPVRLRRYVLLSAAGWTMFIVVMLAWGLLQQRHETLDAARIQARSAFEKDVVYRHWNAEHGGVYVPVSEDTPPNPYLSHVEERNITTPSGRRLTLVNPAYMTRQVHELARTQYGLRGHITSLNPIRLENAPDPWEAAALRAFERGETEVTLVKTLDGELQLRLMRPLVTEEPCLKCHAAQGYKVGDIRGGISIAVPMAPLQAIARDHATTLALGHGLLWLLGLGGVALGARRIATRVRERDRAEAATREVQARLVEQQRHEKERIRAELDKVREELVRKTRLATIGQVSASIAHDLRNPLGSVRNAAYFLRRRLAGNEPQLAEHLDVIDQEVTAADRIISGLMDMTRAKDPVKQPLDLGQIVQEAFDRINLPEQIRWRMSLDPDPFTVSADSSQLRQVVGNIVNNAAQAMEGPGEILVTTSRFADYDTIIFEDEGPGVAPEIGERVFEPLFTTRSKGTGLGLTICRQIVERHGGTIDMLDHTGRGAAFRIRLPR